MAPKLVTTTTNRSNDSTSGWLIPRIWRAANSNFYDDEPLKVLEVYTIDKLKQIASHGFNAVWLRGELYNLMLDCPVLPGLNQPRAEQRIENLQQLIERGRNVGVGVYLYFNEPLALPADDPFWEKHADLKGQPHREAPMGQNVVSLCTSKPIVQQFLRETISGVLESLKGLAGVILITASEFHTHCWSHRFLRSLDYGFSDFHTVPMKCRRCADREPAEIVAELLGAWATAARGVEPHPHVLAWNWSWSVWYPDPQAQVIERLPKDIELLVDWERGGTKHMFGRTIPIDEYSLSYIGPSERYTASHQTARGRNIPVHARLQIGTTHEIATVPNLPLIQNLHGKLCGLYQEQVSGVMACWNFGCALTLNTFAFDLFCKNLEESLHGEWFLKQLAQCYFGTVDDQAVVRAWSAFCQAFELFPFSIRMLYLGPINYAPAYPLSLEYRNAAMGPAWLEHEWGDRLDDCLGPFTLDEVIDAFDEMAEHWAAGLDDYHKALWPTEGATQEQLRHRSEELSCARMIGCHLRCVREVFRFHRWRVGIIAAKDLQPPCEVPLAGQAVEIIKAQIADAQDALALAECDTRLGFHQEPQVRCYDPERIRLAIAMMHREIAAAS